MSLEHCQQEDEFLCLQVLLVGNWWGEYLFDVAVGPGQDIAALLQVVGVLGDLICLYVARLDVNLRGPYRGCQVAYLLQHRGAYRVPMVGDTPLLTCP